MHKNILNDYLPWDGSHLGSYADVILEQWSWEGITYYIIVLPKGWNISDEPTFGQSRELSEGVIYCTAIRTKSVFPCIVEELKPLFGLARRGIHRIIIDKREYMLCYVPITVDGKLVWDIPLSRLDLQHSLRVDQLFRFEVQKIIAFCDLLALTNTNESHILVRPGTDKTYVPVNSNENNTSIIRQPQNDFSIISKVLFIRWFGEDTSIHNVVKNMVGYSVHDNLTVALSKLRDQLHQTITKYDRKLSWYTQFIFDRVSKHLLIND
jgi:hypothetical protein